MNNMAFTGFHGCSKYDTRISANNLTPWLFQNVFVILYGSAQRICQIEGKPS
jgi:hypothetical protein